MTQTVSIQLLSSETSLPRSSHSCAVIGDVLYIIGGELNPREPASPFLHAFNLKGDTPQRIVEVDRQLTH
jgi:hypothetical protein